jgi:uncharacterized integral membrane protein
LRRILRWIIGVPLALAVAAFAVANRRWTELSLDPFSQENPAIALGMPVWALFFAGILLGLLVGWAVSWVSHGKWRKAARDARAEASRLQIEMSDLKGNAQRPVTAATMRDTLPLVPLDGGFL